MAFSFPWCRKTRPNRRWVADFELFPMDGPSVEVQVIVTAPTLADARLMAEDMAVTKVAEHFGDAAVVTTGIDMWSLCQIDDSEDQEGEDK